MAGNQDVRDTVDFVSHRNRRKVAGHIQEPRVQEELTQFVAEGEVDSNSDSKGKEAVAKSGASFSDGTNEVRREFASLGVAVAA